MLINAAGSRRQAACGKLHAADGRWRMADSRLHLLVGIQPVVQVLFAHGKIRKSEKRQGDENRFLFLVPRLIFLAPGGAGVGSKGTGVRESTVSWNQSVALCPALWRCCPSPQPGSNYQVCKKRKKMTLPTYTSGGKGFFDWGSHSGFWNVKLYHRTWDVKKTRSDVNWKSDSKLFVFEVSQYLALYWYVTEKKSMKYTYFLTY